MNEYYDDNEIFRESLNRYFREEEELWHEQEMERLTFKLLEEEKNKYNIEVWNWIKI